MRFKAHPPIPAELHTTFHHLYWDMAWFGILSGSSLSFLSVYAARLNADAFQIGLLNAGPAVVGLLFTLPAGRWLQRRPVGGAVFWSAVLARLGYLFWAILPIWLSPTPQIWLLTLLVLLMTIPGTVLSVGFNALYASAVPMEWRGHVVGIRNALLSVVFVATSLICGWLLNTLPFVLGYQIIFALGFVGAAFSTYHLWFLRHVSGETVAGPPQIRAIIGDFARPGDIRILGVTMRATVALRAFTRGANLLELRVLRGVYGRMVAALCFFHIALYLPVPLFPLYWVEQLHLSDGEISVATAAFHLAVLIGSLWVSNWAQRWGNQKVTAVGALFLSFYPLMTAYMPNIAVFVITSLIGGAAWSLVAGSIGNYLLEKVPTTDRPAHLAWYNLSLNVAVLLGSLGGPLLAAQTSLVTALVASFFMRALSAYFIWRMR